MATPDWKRTFPTLPQNGCVVPMVTVDVHAEFTAIFFFADGKRRELVQMMSGECNCGAVAYELSADPWGVFVCHCSICRRSTGTNGNAVLVIGNEDFHWQAGVEHISTWRKPGHDWQTWFCRICGSQVPGANDESSMFIPAGSISEEARDLRVIHHTWVDAKAGWDEIGDSGRKHPEAFKG